MLYLSKIVLTNVRCFEKVKIPLSNSDDPGGGWTVFVGDNATGKSAILRAIAIGLCDEASAAALLKESDEGYIKRDKSEAKIVIGLFDPKNPTKKYKITTVIKRIERSKGIFADKVRQTTIPKADEFPWDEIFVSGYGAGRGVVGSGDISGYSSIDAVYNMFNYSEGLQNPELVIRRFSKGNKTRENRILNILRDFTDTKEVHLTDRGITVDGPWGNNMPLRDLADGYKSSFAWLMDFLGWILAFNPQIKKIEEIEGILILDEIEQHLHARWQRTVVDHLRKLFPKVQFIAATHSPLVASSVGNYEHHSSRDALHVLETNADGVVECHPHEFMMGWRMDQVLASRAFKFQFHPSPDFERVYKRGSQLATQKTRNSAEKQEYAKIKERLRNVFLRATTPIGRAAEIEANEELQREMRKLEKELFGESQ